MIPDFIRVAELVHEGMDPNELNGEVLGKEKRATSKRQLQELKLRLAKLTKLQIEILVEGTLDEQKHITHLALCKSYEIYKDFIVGVLAEKIQVYDMVITDLDYNSFISKKEVAHPELFKLTEKTQKKVKQVIFRMLQQVGIIDSVSNPHILTPNLSTRVKESIIRDDPKWLTCFLQNI